MNIRYWNYKAAATKAVEVSDEQHPWGCQKAAPFCVYNFFDFFLFLVGNFSVFCI